MSSRNDCICCLVVALAMFTANCGPNKADAAQEDLQSTKDGFQVLTRGPVHEAFAETVTFDPQPGIVVPKAAPAPIEELPPNQRPEGDNIAWIPGYWAWDDERDDFLWVSGIWRALPPGRQWLPGYWGKLNQGFQWSPGYWADANVSEVEYLPAPPATAEVGPNIVAPSADHIWTPGCWVWIENRYAWRPGYWMLAQQNWVWVPAHYLYSPQGYLFVDGYYDYAIDNRGVLFAPIYFESRGYAHQGFTYQPAMAVNLAVFASQLFLRPNYNHYYFGDYYGANYSTAGFHPPFSFNSRGYGYDPFYAQQHWQNRKNAAWAKSVQDDFQHRVDHEDARPPRTLAAQQALMQTGGNSNLKNFVVATSLDNFAQVRDSSWRFQAVTKEEQLKLVKDGQAIHQFGEARQKLEAAKPVTSAERLGKGSGQAKLQLPTSPLVAKSPDPLNKDKSPPKSPEAPKLDSKVTPTPRQAASNRESLEREAEMRRTSIKPVLPELPQAKPNVTNVDPKVEPKPIPRVEPQPAPKVEPKPAPKVEPKPAPRVEPKPAPRVEPKPAPKVEPQPAPRVK